MNKKTVVFSLMFKLVERLGLKAIGLVISVVLARLLSPEDFGQIAIMMVFINLSQVLIHGGLNTALVQKKKPEESDYVTVLCISFGVAVVAVALLHIFAPAIGNFYESEGVVLPLRIYSISLLFGAFNSVQQARMQKEMRFRSMMICNLASTVAAGCLGIGLAYAGWGIWSLIVYYFGTVVLTSISMLLVERWIPRGRFSRKNAGELFSYGWKMMVSGLLCSIYNDVNSLLVGKKFSTTELGYYNRGQQFPQIISMTLDNAIQSVMLPTMAGSQDSRDEIRALLRRTLTMGALLILPTMIGLAVVSEPVIRIVLTEKWLPSLFFMQMICIADAKIPFTSAALTAIKATGRSDVYMRLETVRRVAMLLVLAGSFLLFDSVKVVAVGFTVSAWLDVVIVSIPAKRLFGYGLAEQIGDTWKIFLATFIMGAVVWAAGLLPVGIWAQLLIQIAVGIITYLTACALLKIEAFRYFLTIINSFTKKH